MSKKAYYEQHRTGLTVGELKALLEKESEDALVGILSGSDALYTIKRTEQSVADSEFTKKEQDIVILRI